MGDLNNAKVGEFIIYGPSYDRKATKVDRLTATQVVSMGMNFRKADGKRIGSSGWDVDYAKIPGDAELKEVQQKQLIRELSAWINSTKVNHENMHLFEKLRKDVWSLKVAK